MCLSAYKTASSLAGAIVNKDDKSSKTAKLSYILTLKILFVTIAKVIFQKAGL